jgi:5-hydroxyisourate hydrolase
VSADPTPVPDPSLTISTHVLDVARGSPAAGVPVALERLEGSGWAHVAATATDADGRASLVPDGAGLPGGRYRLTFDTAAYHGGHAFHPQVVVVVELAPDSGHTHVPLLLSPFGYTTYRGT